MFPEHARLPSFMMWVKRKSIKPMWIDGLYHPFIVKLCRFIVQLGTEVAYSIDILIDPCRPLRVGFFKYQCTPHAPKTTIRNGQAYPNFGWFIPHIHTKDSKDGVCSQYQGRDLVRAGGRGSACCTLVRRAVVQTCFVNPGWRVKSVTCF